MIKTVTTTTGVNTVTFPEFFKYFWIKNIGDTTVYASAFANVSAGVDNTSVIKSGDTVCVENIDNDNVYISGEGSVEIHAQNYADCPFKAGGKGGEIPDLSVYAKKNDIQNENLLINPDFKINQRNLMGWTVRYNDDGTPNTATQVYVMDRWRIMDGTIAIADGKVHLSGTIIQVLENSIGSDFTATVSVESGTATASYDDSTKTFTIVGNSAVLNWAKLEYGSNATQFSPPDTATELLKCMRYYEKIVCSNNMYNVACQFFNNLTDCVFSIPMMPKRVAYPTSTIDYSAMNYQNSENIVNVSNAFANEYTVNSVSIVAKLSSPTTVCTHGWVVDFTIEIDAEIY